MLFTILLNQAIYTGHVIGAGRSIAPSLLGLWLLPSLNIFYIVISTMACLTAVMVAAIVVFTASESLGSLELPDELVSGGIALTAQSELWHSFGADSVDSQSATRRSLVSGLFSSAFLRISDFSGSTASCVPQCLSRWPHSGPGLRHSGSEYTSDSKLAYGHGFRLMPNDGSLCSSLLVINVSCVRSHCGFVSPH